MQTDTQIDTPILKEREQYKENIYYSLRSVVDAQALKIFLTFFLLKNLCKW